MMKKLYEKSELSFALFWIVVYCIAQSTAFPLSQMIGIESAANAAFSVILTVILFCWVKKNGLMERYGLCRTSLPAARFLWYLPLVLLVSENLWNGVAINFPLAGTLCYMTNMLCVGFLEEILFRGFLFKAIIAKDGAKKAIIISSVTFGLGHLLNLLNGRGMELVTNLCQVTGAMHPDPFGDRRGQHLWQRGGPDGHRADYPQPDTFRHSDCVYPDPHENPAGGRRGWASAVRVTLDSGKTYRISCYFQKYWKKPSFYCIIERTDKKASLPLPDKASA